MSETSQSILPDSRPAPIEEPPLKNQKSCLRRGCSFLFGLLILIIILLSLISWLFGNPSSQRLAALPTEFPTDIPLYKFEERSVISYLPAKEKDKLTGRIAKLPKIILNSILATLNIGLPTEIKQIDGQTVLTKPVGWAEIKKTFQAVAGPQTDTVIVLWENVEEKNKIVYDFYEKNLRKQDYQIETGQNKNRLNFKKNGVTGALMLEDGTAKNGLNITLRVDYSKK